MSEPRVIFIHGLEGHPDGTKVQMLRRQGFEVHAANMHMSVWQLGRRNSVIRNLLRASELRLALLGAALGLAAAFALASVWPALAVVGAAAWLGWRRRALTCAAIGRSFDRCVEIQAKAVTEVQPDIVVGSSWGGAVAVELLLRGVWAGPTILLAPAVRKVSEWSGRTDPSDALTQLDRCAQPVLVFHDPSDDVVPHADSVELARGQAIELRSVDAGGHRLLDLLERGELADAIVALTET